MHQAAFFGKNLSTRVLAGVVAALLAFASILTYIPSRLAHAAGLDPVIVIGDAENPSMTTLGVGDQFIVHLDYRQSLNDLAIDPNGSCTINGKDVKSTFQNFGDGTFQLVYTVGAGDQNAAAGQIPFSCAFNEVVANGTTPTGNSGVVSSYTSPNNIAISVSGDTSGGTTGGGTTGGDTTGGGTTTGGDTTGGGTTGGGTTGGGTTTGGDTTGGGTTTGSDTTGGGTTTGTPSITNSTVTATPSSGTIGVGQAITIDINNLDHISDLFMADGFCKINNVEVNSLNNLGGGHYQIVHVYTANDADIAPGNLTFTCNLQSGQQIGTLHLTQPTTVAIDTQPNGGNDGLPPAGTFQVSAEPSTGTINPGDMVIIRANDSGGITDFAVDPSGTCTVNGKDVSASFQAFGDHTYQLVYTVAQGDPNVAAGQLAVSCAVKNPSGVTGSIHAFTDGNTVAIAGGGTTGGGTTTGTTTDNGGNNNNNNGGTTTGTTTDNGGTNTGGNNNNGGTTSGTSTETNGNVNGDVTGGTNTQNNGVLAVTSINQLRSTAIADGTFENGWKWVFHITVPSNETKIQFKFGNWMHTNGVNSISPASNMRITSSQVAYPSGATEVLIGAADEYSAILTATGDLDPVAPGKQIEVTVEMGVPIGSVNGSYSTTYHVKSSN